MTSEQNRHGHVAVVVLFPLRVLFAVGKFEALLTYRPVAVEG